jgi:citrate synthase
MSDSTYAKGLEGVIVAESSICKIDGQNGKLYYRGYSIEDIVEYATYEEVTYLLLYSKLPNRTELEEFSERMRNGRILKPEIIEMIRFFPRDSHPMELLQSVISYLSGYVEHKIQHSPTCNCRRTLHQVAQLPSVIAAFHRLKNGQEYVPPRGDLSHGANFLYMLHGEAPGPEEGAIMDKCLVLHAEHSLNASTFTARVVASTMSTCYCSIAAAIGALYGSLHGGANEKVVAMIDEIGTKENAEPWVNKALDEHQKIMGMGHRVYKALDPRARVMEVFLKTLSEKKGDFRNYDILNEIKRVFRVRMEQKGKPIYPNVDFLSGSVYTLLNIPASLFTPIFAMARTAGWLAHILEQREHNRLFRPRALYKGDENATYIPLDERS